MIGSFFHRVCFFLVFGLLALGMSLAPSQAHFSQGTKVRSIILATDIDERNGETQLVAYVRSPVPLVFAGLINQAEKEKQRLASPFLRFETNGPNSRYRLRLDRIAANAKAFETLLNQSLIFSQAGHNLPSRVTAFSLRSRDPGTPFNSIAIGKAAVLEKNTGLDPVFGNAVIDYKLVFSDVDPDGTITVRSGHAPITLGANVSVDHHVMDARTASAFSFTSPGQLENAVAFDGSLLSTIRHFIYQGMLHILEGLDHVLLVVALALGVTSWRKLLWLVTAFTLGHSVTLIATFLGATPTWPWFIPAVETGIAASVLYAALMAIWGRTGSVVVFGAIGLLHGLGFSFVLGEILGRDAPDLIPALLSFNLGIEVGQLIILSAASLLLALISHIARPVAMTARVAALCCIALLSGWWIIERINGLL